MERALVVGLGRMGGFHRKILTDLGYLVETLDPDPHAGAAWGSLADVDLERFSVVVVATPPPTLSTVAEAVAGPGRKVLVEKPFAPNYEQAVVLDEQLSGEQICVGFVERFNPQVQLLHKLLLPLWAKPTRVRFVRWSDRPTWDLSLDLRLHDLDLARYLGVAHVAEYDTRAEQNTVRREIEVTLTTGTLTVDLTRHNASPLHSLWREFLAGGDYPKPHDALRALRASADYDHLNGAHSPAASVA